MSPVAGAERSNGDIRVHANQLNFDALVAEEIALLPDARCEKGDVQRGDRHADLVGSVERRCETEEKKD
jgi:hypothetical protein